MFHELFSSYGVRKNGKPSRSSLATITAARKLSDNVDLLLLEAANKEHIANLTSARKSTILLYSGEYSLLNK